MEIILLKRVGRLGRMGDRVTVRPGYARNFLLPQGHALRATQKNLDFFEARKEQLKQEDIQHIQEAEVLKSKMEGTVLSLIRQANETGHLYGSVNASDIAEALASLGFKIARNQIHIGAPIRVLGAHEVIIQLHPEVSFSISLRLFQAGSQQEHDEKELDEDV